MQTTHDPVFGAQLKRYREAAALSQEALAERAQISVRCLIYLERGRHQPHPHTVPRLPEAPAPSPPERATLIGTVRRGSAAAAQTAAGHPPPALPVPATPLIGREAEVRTLAALLRRGEVRLLTLT